MPYKSLDVAFMLRAFYNVIHYLLIICRATPRRGSTWRGYTFVKKNPKIK